MLCSKLDLCGASCLLLGAMAIFFPVSPYFSHGFFIVALACFARSFYEARADLWAYKTAINHYKSILSSATDSWIAWDDCGRMIGVSKQFKIQLKLEAKATISLEDILQQINPNDAKSIRKNIMLLSEKGSGFNATVDTYDCLFKLDLNFFKITNRQVETLILWCRNITNITGALGKLQKKLDSANDTNEVLNSILDQLPIPVWARDSNLKIKYCNLVYTKIVDSTRESIVKNNIPLIAGNIFGQGHSLAETVRKTQKKHSICQSATISGARRKLNITESPFGADYVGYAIDQTELEDAISSLDKVIKTQGEILESLPTAIAIFGQNMRLTYFNSAYSKLNNFDEIWLNTNPLFSEILDKKRICRLVPEYADFVGYKQEQIQMFTTLMSQKQDMFYLPNGNVIRRFVAPYPLGGLIFLFDDITDSLALKRENSTILAVQKETINNLMEGVCVFGSDNKLRFINPNALKLWNITNEISGAIHISEFVEYLQKNIDFVGDWHTYKSNIISNLTDRIMKTGRIIKKDGGIIFFSYTPLPDGSHLHCYMDVTDTCKVGLAIHEKEQAISISNQAKNNFIFNISAEIISTINIIIGFAELLEKQYFGQLNDKQEQYCKGILSATNKINTLVKNIKAMNRINPNEIVINKETLNLNRMIYEVVAAFKQKADELEIELIGLDDSKRHNLYADKQVLKQILFNIITNLLSFLSQGGSIKIIVDESAENIRIKVVAQDSLERHYSKIRSFQRMSFKNITKITVGEKINLGLPIVESLLERQGGRLEVVRNNSTTTIICVFDKSNEGGLLDFERVA